MPAVEVVQAPVCQATENIAALTSGSLTAAGGIRAMVAGSRSHQLSCHSTAVLLAVSELHGEKKRR